MPFRSEAQRAYFRANLPKLAAQWERDTPPGKLPEHVEPTETPKAMRGAVRGPRKIKRPKVGK